MAKRKKGILEIMFGKYGKLLDELLPTLIKLVQPLIEILEPIVRTLTQIDNNEFQFLLWLNKNKFKMI